MKPTIIGMCLLISTSINAQSGVLRKMDFYTKQQYLANEFIESQVDPIGYKPFLRHSFHYANRIKHFGDTRPADAYVAFEQNEQIKGPSNHRDVNWRPVGPNKILPSPQPLENRGLGRLNVVRFTEDNSIFAGAASGGIWKSINDGESWIPLNNGLPILRISDIAIDPFDAQVMYTCLGDINTVFVDPLFLYPSNFGEGVYKSVDGGENWMPTGLSFEAEQDQFSLMRRVIIHPEDPNILIAAGISGIWKSQDGGDQWSHIIDDQIFFDIDQSPISGTTLYATTTVFSSQVYKSTNFGDTWEALDIGAPQDGSTIRMELAIATNDSFLYVLAVDDRGGLQGIYQSTNAAETWELRMDRSSGPNIFGRFNGDPSLVPSEEFGQGFYDISLIVDPKNPNKLYAGGINIWASEDAGMSWDIVSFTARWFGNTIHQDIHQIIYNSNDNKYYVCNDGGLDRTDSLVTADINFALLNCYDFDAEAPIANCYELPTEWEHISDGLGITEFYKIGIDPSSTRFLAGCQDNSVFFGMDNTIINIFDGDGMQCLFDQTDPNVFYAGMELGRLEVSYDGGQTVIDNMTAPLYEDPTQFPAWVTPYAQHPEQPNKLYTGFSDLWLSEDQAQTWTKVSNLPSLASNEPGLPIRDIEITRSNPEIIYLSRQPVFLDNQVIPGELWKSIDAGANWLQIDNGLPTELIFNAIVTDEKDPNELWIACSHFEDGEKIFYSDNGGTNWQNRSYNLPNLPVNTLIKDHRSELNILYAGLDRGVYYNNDTLNEWIPIAEDLPNVIISDLKIDYNSDKLLAATFGRGIWERPINSDVISNNFQAKRMNWNVSPNPSQGDIQINIYDNPRLQSMLVITDILGNTVQQLPITGKSLIMTSLKTGIYFIGIEGQPQFGLKKVVIQN